MVDLPGRHRFPIRHAGGRAGAAEWLIAGAALLALAGSAYALLAPAYSGGETVIAHNGDWVVALLAAFTVIATLPLFAGSSHTSAWALAAGGVLICSLVLTVASIYYVPSAVLLLIGGALLRHHSAPTR